MFKSVIAIKAFLVQPLIPVIILSVAAWLISYSRGLTMSYNDAMSHLNIARLVFDNQEPGLAQIGSVWLPLNHLLTMLFVWNDWAWQTGLAGSSFSMASFVISVFAIYKTVFILTKKRAAGIIGALAFATNLNMLYLQTTPLTEPLYIAIFTLSVLVFTLWLNKRNNTKYLLLLGILGFFQVLARYDGWFVVIIEMLLIIYNELVIYKKTFHEGLGKLILFGLPVIFGISLWLLWNALIFGSPLYFAFGPFSAHAQQLVIEHHTKILTKGNIYYSLLAYWFAMLHNIGGFVLFITLFALIGFVFFQKHQFHKRKRILLILLLISPILFNIISLFLGFSILNIPELKWNPSGISQGQWFNVRYGILALPFAATMIGIFSGWKKVAIIIALEVLVIQGYATYTSNIITIVDGTKGSSSFRNQAVAEKLRSLVKPNETILMSIAFFSPVAYKSDLHLKQIIHEGVSRKWPEALQDPEKYADLIVLGGVDNSGDPVRQTLIILHKNSFLKNYIKIYGDNEASIYKLKSNFKLASHNIKRSD